MSKNNPEDPESYVIIGTPNPRMLVEWKRAFERNSVPFKPTTGSYKNEPEAGMIFNARHWLTMEGYLQGEESVLFLGPKPSSSGHRPAILHFLNGDLPRYLGKFRPVEEEEARKSEAWTFDGETYFVASL